MYYSTRENCIGLIGIWKESNHVFIVEVRNEGHKTPENIFSLLTFILFLRIWLVKLSLLSSHYDIWKLNSEWVVEEERQER